MTTPPTRRWFRARDFGWGLTPASAEGWLLTAAFVLADVGTWLIIAALFPGSTAAIVAGFTITIVFSTAFIAVCFAKGERPSWHWGRRH